MKFCAGECVCVSQRKNLCVRLLCSHMSERECGGSCGCVM